MNARRGIPLWAAVLTAALAALIVVFVVVGVALAHRNTLNYGTSPQPLTDTPTPISSAPVVTSTPTATPAATTPVAVATGFVAAFTNRDLTGTAWEKAYDSYLTADAQKAYQYTDQDKVPGTKVTGTAVLTAGGTTTGTPGTADAGDDDPAPAIVTVPTDAGNYTVNLQQVAGSWQVLSAQTPGEN
jgi:hypothetical protein